MQYVDGQYRFPADTNWLLPEGTIVVRNGALHSSLHQEWRVHDLTTHIFRTDGSAIIGEKITFCPPGAIVRKHNHDYEVNVPDWMREPTVKLAGVEVSASVLEHTSKKLYDIIRAGTVDLFPGGRNAAGTFVAKTLEDGWCYLTLAWEDKIDIAKIVYLFEIECLYPEILAIFQSDANTDSVAELNGLSDFHPRFKTLANNVARALKSRSTPSSTEEFVEACVALTESRKRKKMVTE